MRFLLISIFALTSPSLCTRMFFSVRVISRKRPVVMFSTITRVTRVGMPIITPPRVDEISATGSGDVLLACILHARFTRGLSLADAVAFALPYAAANAAHPGIAEFPEPTRPRRP